MRSWFTLSSKIIAITFLINFNCLAQFEIELFNTENSELPFNSVQAIVVGPDKEKWIGTDFGLAKLDNGEWTIHYSSLNGLSNDQIRSLWIDSQQNLWVGTFTGGLNKFDGVEWENFLTSDSDLLDNFVKSIQSNVDDELLVGTAGGLNIIDNQTGTWTSFNIASSDILLNNVNDAIFDSNGTPWISSVNGGLIRIIGESLFAFTSGNSPIPDNSFPDLSLASNGDIFATTIDDGLVKYSPVNNDWTIFNTFSSLIGTNNLTAVNTELDNLILVGSINKGLQIFDGEYWTEISSSNSILPDNYITAISVENDSCFWLGTETSGVIKVKIDLGTGFPLLPERSQNLLSIHSNPCIGNCHFVIKQANLSIKLYSIEGNLILDKLELKDGQFSTEELASGVYLLLAEVQDGIERETIKIVIP